MNSKKKNPPPQLPETLAKRVFFLREGRNMTLLDLARATNFPIKRIEEIEAGIEVWLSIADRSILARALGVQPAILKEAETCPSDVLDRKDSTPAVDLDELADRVVAGETNLPCPKCGQILKTSLEVAYDFEGQPVKFARAYCPQCPFALR